LKWQKEVERGVRNGQDKLAFTCSWSDWFIKEADEWRMDAWNIIRLCPDITFQILTKRIERAAENLPPFWDEIRDHVWLGTSVENQKAANERIPHLLRCPASVRFLSCEPLLEGVGLVGAHETIPYEFDATGLAWSGSNVQYERLKPAGIHWVIVGGESGAGARVCDVEWIERIVADCRVAGIPCFVKQLGAQPHGYLLGAWGESKKSRLNIRDRKGGDPAEWPEALRVREFPQIRVSGGAS
jgi:protein gp37